MKSTLIGIVAALAASSGCVVVAHQDVEAGDSLDAYFKLTWTTEDIATGIPLDCFAIGADTVRVIARNTDTTDSYTDLFNCDDLAGSTFDLTAGGYYIDVDLVACGTDPDCFDPFVFSTADTVGLVEVWEDGSYDLGHFVFYVD